MGETWLCIDCKDERVSGPDEICIGCLIAEVRRAEPDDEFEPEQETDSGGMGLPAGV
jgi:hypothetical protein